MWCEHLGTPTQTGTECDREMARLSVLIGLQCGRHLVPCSCPFLWLQCDGTSNTTRRQAFTGVSDAATMDEEHMTRLPHRV